MAVLICLLWTRSLYAYFTFLDPRVVLSIVQRSSSKVLRLIYTFIVGCICSGSSAPQLYLLESEDLHTRAHNYTVYMRKDVKMESFIGGEINKSKFSNSKFSDKFSENLGLLS